MGADQLQHLADSFINLLPKEDSHNAPPKCHNVVAEPSIVGGLCKWGEENHPDLWNGQWEVREIFGIGPTGYPSQSEADDALVHALAREAVKQRVAPDQLHATVEAAFSLSALAQRDKWAGRPDYRERTVARAVEHALKDGTQGAGEGMTTLTDGLIAFSDEPPPPRDYVLADLILAVKVCVLAGFGGISKTQWLIQLTICVALGMPFMGKEAITGAVLLLLGEEDAEEIFRRVNAVAKQLGLTAEQKALIVKRVRAYPMNGKDIRFTSGKDRSLESTGYANTVIELSKKLESESGIPVRLIGLDHAGLIHGGEFNAREDVVQTMRQANRIAHEANSAVMVLAHSPKAAAKDDKAVQAAVAGSTAWVDLARAVFVLRAMDEKEGKRYDIHPASMDKYVSLTVVKNNYGPTGGVWWFARETVDGYGVGHLQHVDLRLPGIEPAKAEKELRGMILDLIREKPLLTKTRADAYAGKAGRLKVSKAAVRAAIDEMLADKTIALRNPTDDEKAQQGIKGQTDGFLTIAQVIAPT